MKALTIFKERERPVKLPKTINPWLLETVENGLRATNVKELLDDIRADKTIPVKYFEYDRLQGKGAFQAPLRVMEMFSELKSITPKTIGYIFGGYKYLYISDGILRRNHETGKESFYSDETLRNQTIEVYFDLDYTREESTVLEVIQDTINELDNATSKHSTNTDRPGISHQDSE